MKQVVPGTAKITHADCMVLPPDRFHSMIPNIISNLYRKFHNDCCNRFPVCCNGNKRRDTRDQKQILQGEVGEN